MNKYSLHRVYGCYTYMYHANFTRLVFLSLPYIVALEERLSKQYRDLESERELLRSLAGRLETHLCQQSQAVETEKWSVQQERVRLRAGERALQEERNSSLARLEEERRSLAESKVRLQLHISAGDWQTSINFVFCTGEISCRAAEAFVRVPQ